MTSRIACVIPAYEAGATLGTVVEGLRRALPAARIVSVDDGSTDDTRRVAAMVCDRVIAFDENRGKGAALRAGFVDALSHGATCVLTLDADGQHDPVHAPALVAGLAEADIVIGARARAGTAMPLERRLSNALSTMAVSFLARCDIADSQSGYRAIGAHVLERVRPVGDRYEFETDLLIRAGRAGFRIACLPVATIYRGASHFRAVHDTARVVRTLWRHRMRA
jgi:glycosyltransferase involved in cell wall biosynthesis